VEVGLLHINNQIVNIVHMPNQVVRLTGYYCGKGDKTFPIPGGCLILKSDDLVGSQTMQAITGYYCGKVRNFPNTRRPLNPQGFADLVGSQTMQAISSSSIW